VRLEALVEKPNDLIGNGTFDLPVCSILPQSTTLPRSSIVVRKPEGKRPLGKLRRRWKDDIKIDLREMRPSSMH
jgi:hypothetical protein